jgi:hypothetical protein
LLPNLSQIRRPSKSAIVNSSIAHIHASRRHRLVAARELRLLKHEADALRRELNEWRDRSGLPRVEEPVRGDGFNLVLSGEVEVVVPNNMDDDDMVDEDDEESNSPVAAAAGRSSSDDMDDIAQAAAVALLNANGQTHPRASSSPNNPFTHTVPAIPNTPASIVNPTHSRSQSSPGHTAMPQVLNGRQHPHAQPPMHHMLGGVNGGPMIASSPTGVSYENPAMGTGYDGHAMLSSHPQYGFGPGNFGHNQLPPHILAQLAAEMENKANAAWFNNMGQFTPPSSSNGGSPVGSPFGVGGGQTNGSYPQQRRSVYGDDGRENVVGRERSSSLGSRASPVGNYDMVGGAPGNGGVPRWLSDDGLADSFKLGPPGTGNAPGYAMMM